MRREIVIAGRGGQGIRFMGSLISRVVFQEGKEVAFTATYGPEARGGDSQSRIIISDQPIECPEILEFNIFIAMCQKGYDLYKPRLSEKTMIFYDPDLVKIEEGKEGYSIPATLTATELGNRQSANMVMLGALVAFLDVCHPDSVRRLLSSQINKEAFEKGMILGKSEKQGEILSEDSI